MAPKGPGADSGVLDLAAMVDVDAPAPVPITSSTDVDAGIDALSATPLRPTWTTPIMGSAKSLHHRLIGVPRPPPRHRWSRTRHYPAHHPPPSRVSRPRATRAPHRQVRERLALAGWTMPMQHRDTGGDMGDTRMETEQTTR